MTTVRKGASVEASPVSPAAGAAGAIVAALAQAGTRLLFGVPGGGPNLDVVGAATATGMSFILTHGETAAAIMAATCADLTSAPGAVVVTRGPGLASAVNGIAHAALDRLPVIVIADTVPAYQRDRVSHQGLDQAALGRSVAKAALTAGPGQPGHMAELAVRLAMAAPAGPVLVNMDPGADAVPATDNMPATDDIPGTDDVPGTDDAPAAGGGTLPAPHARADAPWHDLAPLAAALRSS